MVPAFSSARLSFCLLLALTSLAGRAMESGSAVDSRKIENLAAFARVYGYVRFFCPSDAATRVDWDKLAILGAEAVRSAPDGTALRTGLLQVFQPIAPGLRLADNLSMLEALPENSTETKREPLTFWQYRGVNLAGKPGPYQQVRAVVGKNINGRKPLFEPAVAPLSLALQVAPELALAMPTALPVQMDGTTADGQAADLDALLARLAAIDLKAAGVADWGVRVGGVVTVWTVFQHFHPYLDGAGVRWEDALRPALRRTLHDATAEDYYYTLSEMIAQSGDGHGYVYASLKALGGLPVQVALAEEQIVVVGTAGEAPLQKGDVITRVDGIDALEVLRDRERYTAGSPHLRRFRGLNQFGEGPVDSVARLEIVREGAADIQVVELNRNARQRGYFFKMLNKSDAPGFAEVRPGIFYVNLYALTAAELAAKEEQLASARALIFDWRVLGHRLDPKAGAGIQPHADIIPHLIDEPIQASPMLIPQITAPDRAGWSYLESAWPVKPKGPHFRGRVAFIIEPGCVSYGETCMAMIAGYKLATLVGEATAGCNGNANFIELPAGFRVMWTGMDVRRRDRTSFYGVGFGPDVPVTRTLRGIKEGRDEYLEAAIAFLENADK
jgi:hypothetical protein